MLASARSRRRDARRCRSLRSNTSVVTMKAIATDASAVVTALASNSAHAWRMDVVDYEIKGAEMQFVEVELDPGEAAIGEAGSMMFMDAGIGMDTVFGDGGRSRAACSASCWGRQAAGDRRIAVHHRLHQPGGGQAARGLCGALPGQDPADGPAPAGRHAHLPEGRLPVRRARRALGIAFQQKLSVGFFGGEGFIMQKLDGNGLAFVHAGGTLVKRELQPGQTLLVDTGCVVAYTPSVNFEIQYVGKIKTALFGGEGLFFAKLTGPGTVWLQSLPFSRLASRVFAAAPQRGGSREEGSVLGGVPVAGCWAACSAATTSEPAGPGPARRRRRAYLAPAARPDRSMFLVSPPACWRPAAAAGRPRWPQPAAARRSSCSIRSTPRSARSTRWR
jgi:uncharacterized protein (AIM24 family)